MSLCLPGKKPRGKFLKAILKILVYSNLWAGCAVAALVFLSMENFGALNYYYLIFAGSATAAFYNYMRFVQIRSLRKNTQIQYKNWLSEHPVIVVGFAAFFATLSFLFFREIFTWKLLALLTLPGLISLVYPLGFENPHSGFTSLRKIPGLKIFLISGVWSFVTVIIPVSLAGRLDTHSLLEFALRGFLILGLTIPFDIRDHHLDDKKMRTIPQVLGIKNAKNLAVFCLMVYQVWLIARFTFFDFDLIPMIAMLIGVEIGAVLIYFLNEKRNEFYTSFWLEGVPIFCVGILVVTSLIF